MTDPKLERLWYVLHTKSRHESVVNDGLLKKSIEAYLPKVTVRSKRRDRKVTIRVPLFPGYLFCKFDPGECLAYVRWTKGVAKILPDSVNPVPVGNEVVEMIRSLEQKDGIIRNKPLTKDDRIRIARGPMKDVLGIFQHWVSDQGRVRVLLHFVNYQASVELHHSLIERVGQGSNLL